MGALMMLMVVLMSASILWPQPSYIHPDEFFQSTEIVAGDIFKTTHIRAWEFSPDMPLRDISLPYLLQAPAFYILRAALSHPLLASLISEPYAVTVIPRILLALAGILNYCLLLKLCRCFSIDEKVATWYWATSFVTFTFLTRPFSNTTETLLLSALIILVLNLTQCCTRIKTAQGLQREYGKLKRQSFALGLVLCVGMFTRPTFCLFAFAPLLWLVDQIALARLTRVLGAALALLAGAGFALAFMVLAVCNTLYYNPQFFHLLSDLAASALQGNTTATALHARAALSAMRIPSINFVLYNIQIKNVAEHGLHPWYTHFLVNLPLLLGPPCLLFFWNLAGLLKSCLKKQPTDILYAMVGIPILSLSFFPHQEARFLLPLFPIAVACMAWNRVASWNSFKALTLLFNILGFVAFGWLHQGGVIPALSALQTRLKDAPLDKHSRYHVVSYITYMPPRHLLFFPEHGNSTNRLQVHDMIAAHNHPSTLKFRMDKLFSACYNENIICRFFVLLPAAAMPDTEAMSSGCIWRQEAEFCPHISTERLPNMFFPFNTSWEEWFKLVLPQLCLKLMSVEYLYD